jgi:putative ABC transport system permease protein
LNVDGGALLFALSISIVAALIFGLLPALYAAGGDLNDALKSGGRSSSSPQGRTELWSWLVAGEVALASMLLIGAGLALRSFVNLQHVNPGIRPDHVLTFRLRLPTDNLYKSDREQAAFYRRVIDNVEQIPGIQSAGLSDVLPLGQQNDREYFTIEKRPLPAGEALVADFRRISPQYLNTMGIPLLRGRLLSDRDGPNAPPVILIDETLERQYFPNEDPIGRRMRLWGEYREIAGIVGQVHHYGLDKVPEPTIYAPFEQMPDKAMAIAVRTTMDTPSVVRAVKQAVWSVDRGQPVFQIRSMDEYMSLADTAPRLSTAVLAIFAGLSMLLAALGIYGVVSYGVAQRTREFGIRMALGSTPRQLEKLVVSRGIKTAMIGLLVGMAGAAALASAVRTMLFGVAPLDPVVMAGVAALLLMVAFIANYVPARRATRIDPLHALHNE